MATTDNSLPVEFGWGAEATTGWGLLALHMALGLARLGRTVYLPAQATNFADVPATLLPTLVPMLEPGNIKERRIRIDAWGNHWPAFQEIPNRVRVVFAVFEDTAIPDRAIEALQRYDLVLSPSQWIHDLLAAKGVESTIWHQGYDDSLFYPAPRRRPDGPVYVFSGGKLEFRKGQDIVVEAFRRFRETPEGKDAVLVTAWQNRWPQTMVGIWESGYVKGMPTFRNGQLDIQTWLEVNGVPREASIDLGFLSQAEMANAIRECDVGLFPNRCEGATNITLVEALATGLLCIVGDWTGQADVPECRAIWGEPLTLPVPAQLYKGADGWVEADIPPIVTALQDLPLSRRPWKWAAAHEWSWASRCDALNTHIEDAAAIHA